MMKTIVYIVPYFGKLPELFPFWLNSCRHNTTIDWLLFIDDQREFDYPGNVHVNYMTFRDLKEIIDSRFDYSICLESPYKLCDFRVAYGEIFAEYIKEYDFWGFCDIDLIWGDIRHFLTDDILSKYDKIGFQGHSTLVRNTEFCNLLYKKGLKNGVSFKSIAKSDKNCFSDEIYFNKLFNELSIPFYQKFIFANLSPFVWNFRLDFIDKEQNAKNIHFVFEYDKGMLCRVAEVNGEVLRDQYMYVHFLKREMEVRIAGNVDKYLIIPNCIVEFKELNSSMISQYNRPHYFKFLITHLKKNAYKLRWNTLISIITTKIRGYYRLFFCSNKVSF